MGLQDLAKFYRQSQFVVTQTSISRSTARKNASPKVSSFSMPLRMIGGIGGCRISELLAIPHRRGERGRSRRDRSGQSQSFQNASPKVSSFSMPLRMIGRIGGCRICELAGILRRYCKISPRSSYPSPQRCCIHNESQNFRKFAATGRRPGHAPAHDWRDRRVSNF